MNDFQFHKRKTDPGSIKGKTTEVPEKMPENIHGYKIQRLLKRGGMSAIYLATHPETQELVAIKVLSPKYLKDDEVIQRFLRESEIIALADHPNIVNLYSQGEWEGGLYIAMEYVDGISLHQFLQKNKLSLKESLEIALQIAYALCHLHSHGVIHRDLKLENILLTHDNQVKVIDFGIAHLLSEKHPDKTKKRRIMGTPIYMSPEQKMNPESASYPSDIYSLGIMTYELVLGRIQHGKVALKNMPEGLRPILSKSLQPNVKNRYQDIVAFIADLSAYLNSEEIS